MFKLSPSLFLCLFVSCSQIIHAPRKSTAPRLNTQAIKAIQGQLLPPEGIRSLLFEGSARYFRAPIIELGSEETLELSFDDLTTEIRQFRISLTHHNPDWTPSGLLKFDFLSQNVEDYINDGSPSQNLRPAYVHYSYTFPNDRFDVKRSGFYLLHVGDAFSGEELFSLPFFVHENRGESRISYERFLSGSSNPRFLIQPFLSYSYPDTVLVPQADLAFQMVQNQFWGRTKRKFVWDQSRDGVVRIYPDRKTAFPAGFDLIGLDLNSISILNKDLSYVNLDQFPWKAQVQFDLLAQRDPNRSEPVAGMLAEPQSSTTRRYVEVEFRARSRGLISPSERAFLIGSFANWNVFTDLELKYDPEDDLWKTTTLLKEGRYVYKYVKLGLEGYDILAFDDAFNTEETSFFFFHLFEDDRFNTWRIFKIIADRPN